jgi:hypothetical protein
VSFSSVSFGFSFRDVPGDAPSLRLLPWRNGSEWSPSSSPSAILRPTGIRSAPDYNGIQLTLDSGFSRLSVAGLSLHGNLRSGPHIQGVSARLKRNSNVLIANRALRCRAFLAADNAPATQAVHWHMDHREKLLVPGDGYGMKDNLE